MKLQSVLKMLIKEASLNNIDTLIDNLTVNELNFLKGFDLENGMLRKLMSPDELKLANKLVKQGLLDKGISDEIKGSVTYYIDSSVWRRLK